MQRTVYNTLDEAILIFNQYIDINQYIDTYLVTASANKILRPSILLRMYNIFICNLFLCPFDYSFFMENVRIASPREHS